jgi:hypothetical protein
MKKLPKPTKKNQSLEERTKHTGKNKKISGAQGSFWENQDSDCF